MTACDTAQLLGWLALAVGFVVGALAQRHPVLAFWHEQQALMLEKRPDPEGATATEVSRHRGRAADHRLKAEAHSGPLKAPALWSFALIVVGLFARPLAALAGLSCG